jgi:hypothetical protein
MGVRYGVQGHVGDGWNLSPRVTAAWSPFRHGKLTVRANYGYFYDWIADDLYKQSLLVDGDRLRSLNIIAPAYPDPGTLGDAAPTDRYEWPDALVLPSAHRMSVGFDRQLSANTRLNLSYNRNWGRNVARGRNLNTPVNGTRPDPAYANVVELASDGESRSQMLRRINIMPLAPHVHGAQLHVVEGRGEHERRLLAPGQQRRARHGMGSGARRHPAPCRRLVQLVTVQELQHGRQPAHAVGDGLQRDHGARRQR